MVDAHASGACEETHGGSSPFIGNLSPSPWERAGVRVIISRNLITSFVFPIKNNMNKYNLLARYLRKSQTPQEQKLWNLLRNRQLLGYKFKRQYPIGNYIVDFVCREKRLVIELDGGQHNIAVNINYDFLRSEYIKQRGFKVIRFWNKEIDENIEGVIAKITEELNN